MSAIAWTFRNSDQAYLTFDDTGSMNLPGFKMTTEGNDRLRAGRELTDLLTDRAKVVLDDVVFRRLVEKEGHPRVANEINWGWPTGRNGGWHLARQRLDVLSYKCEQRPKAVRLLILSTNENK